MLRYGVIWHPASRNLGDDLQALAAGKLLPRIDLPLDGERLDEVTLPEGERVATLLSGHVCRSKYHWPPSACIRPVCLGLHLSQEDVWGSRFDALEGPGLDYLRANGPVGCRDDETAALLQGLNVPNYVSCGLLLTLRAPKPTPGERYICCVDVPEKAVEALTRYEKAEHTAVREMTHQLPVSAMSESFETRMARAEATASIYAGAAWVVTRRLHCALACLALEVPVLLLYNSGYEDVHRFSPMDQLVATASVEDFTRSVLREGFPKLAPNPAKYLSWRRLLTDKAAEGLQRAETAPAFAPDPAELAAWRLALLTELAESSARKIEGLERDRFDLIHDKFSLLSTEDSVKSSILDALTQPGVEDALRDCVEKRYVRSFPRLQRFRVKRRVRRAKRAGQSIPELEAQDILSRTTVQLARLGWPQQPPTP